MQVVDAFCICSSRVLESLLEAQARRSQQSVLFKWRAATVEMLRLTDERKIVAALKGEVVFSATAQVLIDESALVCRTMKLCGTFIQTRYLAIVAAFTRWHAVATASQAEVNAPQLEHRDPVVTTKGGETVSDLSQKCDYSCASTAGIQSRLSFFQEFEVAIKSQHEEIHVQV